MLLFGDYSIIIIKIHVCITYSTDSYICTAQLTIFFLSSSSNLSLFAASSNAFGLENTYSLVRIIYLLWMFISRTPSQFAREYPPELRREPDLTESTGLLSVYAYIIIMAKVRRWCDKQIAMIVKCTLQNTECRWQTRVILK